jgi:hypothetical protein
VDRWCRARGFTRGFVMPLTQAWTLSKAWYGNRLSADFHRPTTEEARAIFEAAGLRGAFWAIG